MPPKLRNKQSSYNPLTSTGFGDILQAMEVNIRYRIKTGPPNVKLSVGNKLNFSS